MGQLFEGVAEVGRVERFIEKLESSGVATTRSISHRKHGLNTERLRRGFTFIPLHWRFLDGRGVVVLLGLQGTVRVLVETYAHPG